MRVETGKQREGIEGLLCIFIFHSGDGQNDEDLVEMQEGTALAQMVDHEILAGFDHHRGEEFDLLRNIAQILESVEQKSAGGTQKGCRAPGQDGSVGHLHGGSGAS